MPLFAVNAVPVGTLKTDPTRSDEYIGYISASPVTIIAFVRVYVKYWIYGCYYAVPPILRVISSVSSARLFLPAPAFSPLIMRNGTLMTPYFSRSAGNSSTS